MFGALSLGMGRGAARSPFADHEFALDFKRGVYRSGGGIATSPDALPGYSFARTGASYEIGADGLPLLIPSGALPIVPGVGYWARGSVTNLFLHSNPTSAQTNYFIPSRGSVTYGIDDPVGGSTAVRFTTNGSADPLIVLTSALSGNPSGLTQFIGMWVRMTTNPSATPASVAIFCYGNTATESPLAEAKNLASTPTSGWTYISLRRTWPAGMSSPSTTWRIDPLDAITPPAGVSIDVWGVTIATAPSAPTILTNGSQATVTAADMRFTQPIPADEDWAFWATCDFKGAAVSGFYQRFATYSNGTSAERLMIERTDVGSLSAVSVNSGVFQGSNGPSQAGAGRATTLLRRNGGVIKGAGKNGSGTISIGSPIPVALPTGLNRLDIGNALSGAHTNAPIEFFGFRRGTFSDAAITAILEAA